VGISGFATVDEIAVAMGDAEPVYRDRYVFVHEPISTNCPMRKKHKKVPFYTSPKLNKPVRHCH